MKFRSLVSLEKVKSDAVFVDRVVQAFAGKARGFVCRFNLTLAFVQNRGDMRFLRLIRCLFQGERWFDGISAFDPALFFG